MRESDLRSVAWAGKPAFVVLGGPSLRGFDWSVLEPFPQIVAVNRAFLDVPHADIFFTEDIQFLRRYAAELAEFGGLKVYQPQCAEHETQALQAVPSLTIIPLNRPVGQKFWSKSFEEGLSYSQTSAIGALNIADILLGPDDAIYVLGLDCNTDAPRYETYHEAYPEAWRVGRAMLHSMKSDFENWAAPNLRRRPVWNLNLKSGVDCWPKHDRDTILRELSRSLVCP